MRLYRPFISILAPQSRENPSLPYLILSPGSSVTACARMSRVFKTKKTKPQIGLGSHDEQLDRERAVQLVSIEGAMNLEASLQQLVEDSKIIREFSMLREQIRSHVISFFGGNNLEEGRAEIDTLVREQIKEVTRENATTFTNMLLNSKSRATGLRILLAKTLIEDIGFFGDPQRTLLSPAAVALMSLFESKKFHHMSPECKVL